MALDRKTSLRVAFYDHEQEQIQSWAFKSSTRLALLVNTIVYEKDKIDLDKQQFDKSLELIIWDLKKFLNTTYTTDENA
jgi:hypothetical protein